MNYQKEPIYTTFVLNWSLYKKNKYTRMSMHTLPLIRKIEN